jgi:hypothetical protein
MFGHPVSAAPEKCIVQYSVNKLDPTFADQHRMLARKFFDILD